MPNKFYLSTPEAYACKIRNRYGAGANVLAYHWDSRYQGRPTRNDQNAIRAGEILADALVLRGVVPEQTHMIGHSMGSLVIAAAAHRIHCETARRTDKLTMLDGPSWKVEIFIDQLAAPSCANRVINLWAAGPTGAGMPIDRAGVENVEIPNRRARLRTRRRGAKHCRELQPAVINHIDILHWYYEHRL